jgi:hypothetical protein
VVLSSLSTRAARAARAVALLSSLVLAFPADAQRVLGIGDDALVLPRGTFRLRALASWTAFDERYGLGTPGRRAGSLEPVAVDFTLDTIGIAQFPALGAVQTGLRQLTGIRDLGVSLGRTSASSDVRITAVPLVFEIGVTRRLSIAATVPIVRSRHNVGLAVNANGIEGNLGFNPATVQATAAAANVRNALVQGQFGAAAVQLRTQLDACATPPASESPACATINANRASATALLEQSGAFAAGLARIYGTGAPASEGIPAASPFVPIAGTDAQLAIQARVAAFSALFGQFGVSDLEATTFPAAAQSRLGYNDAQTVLTNPAFGLAADSATTIERTGLGDIELAGKFKILDSFGDDERARYSPRGFNYRSAVTGAVRIGTGGADLPAHFLDVGTGTGSHAWSVRSATDLLFGGRFWTSVVGRYTAQLADDQFVRITDTPERVLAAAFRERRVRRDLGDFVELEITPRYVLTDYFALSAQYYYRNKGEDRYTGTFAVSDSVTGYGDVQLDASTLDQETAAREHRLGAGVSFSTLAAFDRGIARIPLELTYYRSQTIRGAGGNVPKLSTDQLQVRLYFRVFGR